MADGLNKLVSVTVSCPALVVNNALALSAPSLPLPVAL
jgi:hypothetical protein